MRGADFIRALVKSKPLIDGSQRDITNESDGSDLPEVLKIILDPINARQMTDINMEEVVFLSVMDASANCKGQYDHIGWAKIFLESYLMFRSSIGGKRSEQVQNISIGQMSRQYEMQLMNARYGGADEYQELKGIK